MLPQRLDRTEGGSSESLANLTPVVVAQESVILEGGGSDCLVRQTPVTDWDASRVHRGWSPSW